MHSKQQITNECYKQTNKQTIPTVTEQISLIMNLCNTWNSVLIQAQVKEY